MFYRLLHHFQHSIKLTDSADFSIHHSNPSWAKIFPKNHSFLIMIKSYKLHDIMLAFKNLLNTKYRFDLPLRLHWDWDTGCLMRDISIMPRLLNYLSTTIRPGQITTNILSRQFSSILDLIRKPDWLDWWGEGGGYNRVPSVWNWVKRGDNLYKGRLNGGIID